MCSSKASGGGGGGKNNCCCLHLLLSHDLVNKEPSSKKQTENNRRRRKPENDNLLYLLCMGPALLATLAYSNSSRGDFVHDDIPAIVNNPDVNGHNKDLLDVFSNDFWGEPMASVRSHKSYRPLTVLIFRLAHYLGQGQSWPFHGTNMILHGCATFFLGCICRRTLQMQSLATLMATFLFALHPIHTEAVSGLVGCADLLAGNLTLLSFMAYTRYLLNPQREVKWHWLSLCFACGAVLSKETGIMALAINVGYGLYQSYCGGPKLRSTFKRLFWTDTLTLFVLLSVRMVVQNSSLPEFSAQDNPAAFDKSLLTRTLTFLYLPVHNFWMLLCPSTLSYDWQMGSLPLITSIWGDPRAFLALPLFYGSLLSFAGFTTIFSNKNKSAEDSIVVAAYLFLILPFLPASNVFFPVGFVLAERILYMPSIGFCLLVALGAEKVSANLWNPASSSSRVDLRKRRRCRKRSCSQSSMSSTASSTKSGRTAKIRRRLRRAVAKGGGGLRAASTAASTEAAAASTPNVCFLALFLVSCGCLLGLFAAKTWTRNYDWNSRRDLFRSGLKMLPTNAKVHYNYANVLKEDGKNQLAIMHYRQALKLWPNYVLAHNNLATLLEDRGEALHHLRMALNIDPWHPNSLYNMAVLFREQGDCSRAIPLLEKCISVEACLENRAYPLLSDCLFSQKTHQHTSQEKAKLTKGSQGTKREQPITDDNSLPSEKNMAAILSHLAEFYIGRGQWKEAEMALQRLLSREPEHEVALYQLSQVYLEQNGTQLALEAIRAAAKSGCKDDYRGYPETMESGGDCIWGPKCTPRANLCAQIVIQEADILRAMGLYKLAAQKYRRALEMSPPQRESELLLNLGSMHHAMGDWELARHHYRQCLELEPNNQVVMANMELLGSQLYELKNH